MDDTKDILVEKSKGVLIDSEIDAKGDVIVGGNKITNIYASFDYQQIIERIKELEEDLEDIPEEKLERRLKKSNELETLRKQENDFKTDTIRLAESFSKIKINTERLQKAKELFEAGKFREADAILKADEMGREQGELLDAKEQKAGELKEISTQLQSSAAEFLIKAQTTSTHYENPKRFEEASHYYDQAIRSYPDFNNHFQYAYFLAEHNQNNRASSFYQKAIDEFGAALTPEIRATTLNNLGALQADRNAPEAALKSYTEALKIRRNLASSNPRTYLPYVAMTLNNLGALQNDRNAPEAALKSYTEALKIRQNLASSNPRTYLPNVANTLNNLGNLQAKGNDPEAAMNSYTEALKIRRDLASSNPRTYLPDVATTLNNLGALQDEVNDPEAALNSYTEALETYRDLASSNPRTYLPYVATTLNNLGNLQQMGNEPEAALKSYTEALETYRDLASSNPRTYLPYVATTLNNLGLLQADRNAPEAALKSYTEALEIRRDLASSNPRTYLPDVAMTLNNLGALQAEVNDPEAALKSYTEALKIRRNLASSNPRTYLPDLALTLMNMSLYYQNNSLDEEKSVNLALEAIVILQPLIEKIPYTKECMGRAVQVLKNWGMSKEEFAKRIAEWSQPTTP